MIRIKTVVWACAAVTMACGASAVLAQTKPPAAAFAVLPAEAPQISPDGSRFALIRGINGRPALAVYKIAAPKDPPQIVTSDKWIVAGFRWVKNDVLVIYDKMNERHGLFETLLPFGAAAAVSLNDNKLLDLSIFWRIEDIDVDDPNVICMSFGNWLYRSNIRERGYAEISNRYPPPERDAAAKWLLDGHCNVVARIDRKRIAPSDTLSWHATLKVLDQGEWREIGTYEGALDHEDGLVGLSDDYRSVIRRVDGPEGTSSVDRIDVWSGAETSLFHDPTYDVAAVLQDPLTDKIIGYVVDEDMPVYRYFDPGREALQKGLEQAFPGLSVHADSVDLAGDKAIVEAVGPKTPASYYLYDRSTHQATAIAAGYPDLTEDEMGEVKPYAYAARDGLHIPAYLTLPPGRQPRNLPLVVMPHGGPDSRDDMTFDFLRQFLANRGYAVLQPQFRGSHGFGRSFTQAGLHEWGLKMQDDISDGVRKTIADGIADPKRICIFGASYGGYAALAGATLTPELYACVASLSGPSNLEEMLHYSRKRFGVASGEFWVSRIGYIDTDSAQIEAASPVLHADRVTAPVLLLHSELDVTVPIDQSEMMDAALRKAGKKVEFVRIDGDDHYLSLEQTRLRVLQELEKFLAASIGN